MDQQAAYALFPVVHCGVDWLTCTSKRVGVSNALEDFGVRVLKEELAGSGRILPANRLGFKGHRNDAVFLGNRPGDVMLQISGPSCTPLVREAITLSTGVSRIDFQVTVWTEGEACDLAGWTFRRLSSADHEGYRPRNFSLIASQPSGDTLSINRRVSDSYGRLYDKTAESSLGPARLLWRYEVELKGRAARRQATRLKEHGAHPTHVSRLVHDWYTRTGVRPAFARVEHEDALQPILAPPTRSVLDWFRQSLSITVSKAIREHGRQTVLEALGLNGPPR